MKTLAEVWSFLAGPSRVTPAATALAVLAAVLLARFHAPGVVLALAYAGIIAAGLIGAAFERT